MFQKNSFLCFIKKMAAETAELFTLYPIEASIVLQRGLEFGAIISMVSLSHCCYLLLLSPDVLAGDETLVAILAIFRLLAALPRPIYWMRARRLLLHAREAANPQAVARRLIAASQALAGSLIERCLMWSFYAWLGITLAICAFSESGWLGLVWKHAWWTVVALVVHRVLGVAFFLLLLRSDLPRGLSKDALEAVTRAVVYGEGIEPRADECGICYAPYAHGDELRVLSCGHDYHSACVDPWLQGHRSVCPLCLKSVDLLGEEKSD